MPNFEDVKTMLTSLLKASQINLTDDEQSEKLKADDGFDQDNPLAQTELYRDEQGNRLPSKLHVVPLAGRPVMPSQISTVQLNIQWLDVITEIISSSHHTFAMFAVSEDMLSRGKISIEDFPRTGTVVRLLSARSGPDEIDIVCEGVRRVSLIEVVDNKMNIARVRYPEIEYRLANPSARDRVSSHANRIKQSLDEAAAFEKKLQALLKEHRQYALSLGLRRVIKEKPLPTPKESTLTAKGLPELPTLTLEFDYFLMHSDYAIGRISLNKLKSMLDFLGIKDLTRAQIEELAISLAAPSAAEMAQLSRYAHDIQSLLATRYNQIHASLNKMPTNAIALERAESEERKQQEQAEAQPAAQPSAEAEAASAEAAPEAKAADSAEGAAAGEEVEIEWNGPFDANNPKYLHEKAELERIAKEIYGPNALDDASRRADIEMTARRLAFLPPISPKERIRNNATESFNDGLTKITKSLGELNTEGINTGWQGEDERDEDHERHFLIADSEHEGLLANTNSALSQQVLGRVSDILEAESANSAASLSSSSGHNAEAEVRRGELFALIARVGQEEEQTLEQAKEKFKDAAIQEILDNIKQDQNADSGSQEVVKGPNIGFVNEDTSVVTFVPGQEASEDLLLRLNDIQKQHEEMLQKAAAEQKGAKKSKKGAKGKAGSAADSAESSAETAAEKEQAVKKSLEHLLDDKSAKSKLFSSTPDPALYSPDGSQPKMIIGDNIATENEGMETSILINNDEQQMPDELKEFLGFLMQGKDVEDSSSDLAADMRHQKWSALQRAAMIRSKLAKLLGGKVVFGVGTIPEREAGAQLDVELRAYCLGITTALQELLPLNPMMTEEMRQYLSRFDMSNPSVLADCAASITQSKPNELQEVLDTIPILPRLKLSFELISRELSAAKLQDKIKLSVAEKIQKRQKDFFLREQLNEIKKELGLSADEKDLDVEKFRERMSKLNPPEHIQKRFKEELDKLSMLETSSPEYGLTHNYLDTLTSIPWGKMSKEKLGTGKNGNPATNLANARKILDQDHEGLQDVKDRIIEFLAVGALKGHTSGQIMLFVGPPGVGKTSIGKSIARALNRPFYRLSLGGIDDVSEIKGHRKTYVGAMAGKIVAALRETQVMNPVIMLDEIDKLGHSYHGDPDSALLETLDPEQNKNFLDVYLDEKIDLSNCLFICTANGTDTISPPLLDRMEPIRLSGYIAKEKFAIAKKHLLPRALKDAGLKGKRSIQIPDQTLTTLIEGYARESGVRSLERAISKLIRKAAVHLVEGEKKVLIQDSDLEEYLGTAPFKKEKMLKGVGIMTGLAWTASGGVTLPVESIVTNHDSQGFKLTGSLGDVMKESANIAYSFVQSHLEAYTKLKKDASFFTKKTVHLHVPEGAIPKDGPSAGVTMATSLLSLALNTAPAENFAMTGELTLTGHVLPIGGLREKVIAARRMGIFDLVIPIGNEGDVKELPEQVRSNVTFYYADTYNDVAYTLFPSVRARLEQQGYTAPRHENFDDSGSSATTPAKATKAKEAEAPAKAPKSKAKASAKAKDEAPAAPVAEAKAPAKAAKAKAKAPAKTTETTEAPATEAKAPAKATKAKAPAKASVAKKAPAAKKASPKATAPRRGSKKKEDADK